MYFINRFNTNIDDEFDENKKFPIQNKKLLIILGIIFLLIISIIIIFAIKKNNDNPHLNYFLSLEGENLITIYKDSEFIDPGYIAKDNLGNILTEDVQIDGYVDSGTIGDYKLIYKFHDQEKTRYISVVEKPIGATLIYLLGDLTVYLDINEEYKEPGYIVIDSVDSTLTDKVVVNNNLDTTKKGTYYIVYSVTNSAGVTTQAKRTVIVTDSDISLSVSNDKYTNKDVEIKINISDNYFDYLLLPDGNKVNNKNYTYKVSSNGVYKFISYNKKGTKKESSIKIDNIDKEKPTGSCSGSYSNGLSLININASDNIGISRYVIDGNSYTSKSITLNKEVSKVSIIIYDKAGNMNTISCNLQDNNFYGKIDNINPSSPPVKKNNNVSVNYYTPSSNRSFAYWFYQPDKLTKNLPIIVYLHPLGGDGDDYHNNSAAAIYRGPIREIINYGYSYNALIINPQLPYNVYFQSMPHEIIELINKIANEFQANKKKISIIGFSHGCYGILTLIDNYQDYFSAAVPIGCNPKDHNVYNYLHTPIWAFSGDGDGKHSMPGFFEKVSSLGGNAKYTNLPGRPHDVLNDNYSLLRDSNYQVINWMISQTK